MSEGLAQDPYVAARVGFEPATFGTQGSKPVVHKVQPAGHIRPARSNRKFSDTAMTLKPTHLGLISQHRNDLNLKMQRETNLVIISLLISQHSKLNQCCLNSE